MCDFQSQDFEELKQACLSEETLFEDPTFPPCDESISPDGNVPDGIEWSRASELCDDPQFILHSASRFDINQGALGDCWFLAAIGSLTLRKELFENVVQSDTQSFSDGDYAGIFHFRFWQFGEWVDVVIDDYLPHRNGRLVYAKSDDGNEFWPALMEKAYAKLYGCYKAIESGKSVDALIDFTGGVGESHRLAEEQPEKLFQALRRSYRKGSFISAGTAGSDVNVSDEGLTCGHAYSVTGVVVANTEDGSQIPLLRIRNPWGDATEWKGPWCDGAPEWELLGEEESERLRPNVEDDGEFFMAFEDFVTRFVDVDICHVTSACSGCELPWHESTAEGAWVAGENAGGCVNNRETYATNPQYMITLTDSDEDEDDLCNCIIAVMQKGSRGFFCGGRSTQCLTIGFSAYHIPDPDGVSLPLPAEFLLYNRPTMKGGFINTRQVSARETLPPGTYIIVPSTFNPDQEGEFVVRVFSEQPTAIEQIQ